MKKIVLLTAISLLTALCLAGVYLLINRPAIETSAEPAEKRIVIDAGHGIPDGGAVGRETGVIEESINLSIAEKLKNLLAEDGWDVIMTREDAQQIGQNKNDDMRRRREIISSSGQKLTVSIHQNFYAGDERVNGPQVFYAPGSEEGRVLAEKIQQNLNDATQTERIAAEGDYYIVKSGSVPAVIVECGFLSNSAEETLLMQSQYQVKIAQAIAKGIAAYCG